MKEKEIIEHLQKQGFKEVKVSEKSTKWYKKASDRPSCLRAEKKQKVKS
jgi:predicted RNA binding protein YcfA (HicA-like mRNA interferase family)